MKGGIRTKYSVSMALSESQLLPYELSRIQSFF